MEGEKLGNFKLGGKGWEGEEYDHGRFQRREGNMFKMHSIKFSMNTLKYFLKISRATRKLKLHRIISSIALNFYYKNSDELVR